MWLQAHRNILLLRNHHIRVTPGLPLIYKYYKVYAYSHTHTRHTHIHIHTHTHIYLYIYLYIYICIYVYIYIYIYIYIYMGEVEKGTSICNNSIK